MVIQTSKTSPARVALHETLDRSFKRSSMFSDDNELTSPSINLNQFITKKSVIRGQAIRYKKLELEPLQLPRESAVKILDDQAFLDSLPAPHRKRVDLAQARSDTLAQDWTIPTIRDAFEEKIAEIKTQTQQTRNANIFVAAADSEGNWTSEAESKANSTAGVEAGTKPASASASAKQEGFLIQGQITIPESSAGEIVMGPGHFMEVRWIDEGIAKDPGRIDLPTSTYKISVPQLTGTISAKMFDKSGQEVASGQFRLNQNLARNQLQMASIDIRPRNRVSRQYSDFYAQANQKSMMSVANHRKNPSPEVMVGAFAETIQADADGTLKVDGLAEGSWSFLRTNAQGFYPTISLASAGDTESSPLFPEKMIKALISIVRDSRGIGLGGETGSIIWGQTKSAFGSGGLKVELEDLPEAKVVYLNELLIPDERLNATSSNGYFAFVDLPRGFYSLRVTRGDKQVAVANVEVDDGAVSPVEVRETSEMHTTGIKVYDSFTGSPLGARVSVQNLERAPDVMGYLEIQTPKLNHLNLVHVNPIDMQYAPALYVQNSNEDYIHLPLVRSDWLTSVRGSLRLSDLPDSGTLIGFVPATGFEVHLTHLPDLDPSQVVYFDAQGQPVPSGVAGGGFVVFNVPAGSHSILVIPQDSNVAQSKVIPVDSGTLNILKFDF
ncbi:MAG: carboxypeptidase-like regulatory domain-containing protein [Bdellovibrio sp.]